MAMILNRRIKLISAILWQMLIALICLLLSINSKAQTKKERIACIGNSITFGARLTQPETASYPAVLSGLLTEKGYHHYEVKNFGIGGATVLRFGTPNLWRILDSLKYFPPNLKKLNEQVNSSILIFDASCKRAILLIIFSIMKLHSFLPIYLSIKYPPKKTMKFSKF